MPCMMPPVCVICSRSFDPDSEGGLIYFKKSDEGREFDRSVREEGITGHPPYAQWFCGKHAGEAKKLARLTAGEARELLIRKFKSMP